MSIAAAIVDEVASPVRTRFNAYPGPFQVFAPLLNSIGLQGGENPPSFVRNTKEIESLYGELVEYDIAEPAYADPGWTGHPQRTNKCTNYNANPDSGAVTPGSAAAFNSATTNLTASDSGSGALFGVVDDAAELAAAGLSGICTSGLVFKIDNSGGSGAAKIDIGGTVGNTNAHSFSVWARGSGTGDIRLSAGEGQTSLTLGSSYAKTISENATPGGTGRVMIVNAGVGAIVYFILNQLEEGAFATSEIVTEGAAATRNASDSSYPVSGNLPVNDCVISFEWTPYAAGQGAIRIFGSRTDADNLVHLFHNGTNLGWRKLISGTTYDATKAFTYIAGTTYNIKFRLSSTNGVDIWIDDVKGTNNSNTTDAVLNTNFYIGQDGSNASYQSGEIKNFGIKHLDQP